MKTFAVSLLALLLPAASLAQDLPAAAAAPARAAATLFVDGNSSGVVNLDIASPRACAAIAAVVQHGQGGATCIEPTKGWTVRNPDAAEYPAPVDRVVGGPVYAPMMLLDAGIDGGFYIYEMDSYEACLQAGPDMGKTFYYAYCIDRNDGRAARF